MRKMKGTDWFGALIPILVVPIALLVMIYVFSMFEPVAYETFEESADYIINLSVNDTYATIPCTYLKDSSCGVAYDGSTVDADNYTLDYTNHKIKRIAEPEGDWNLSCTCYRDGYEQTAKITEASYNAFSLASILPIVIVAMAVVGVIVGGFMFGRR